MASRKWETKVQISTHRGHWYVISWLISARTNCNRPAIREGASIKDRGVALEVEVREVVWIFLCRRKPNADRVDKYENLQTS